MTTMLREKFELFRQLIARDFWRKTVSVFLAIVLYLAVNYHLNIRSEPVKLSGVSVEVQLPPGVVNLDRGVPPVTLTVTGGPRVLSAISSRDFTARARIPEGSFVPGTPYLLKLSASDFKAPMGVHISRIEPNEIALNLEPLATRRIPVDVRFDSFDRLATDFGIEHVSAKPEAVQVTGPESRVNELRSVATLPIPLDRTVTEGFDFTAGLRPIDGLTLSPQRVEVRVEVGRRYAARLFAQLPVRVLNRPEQRDRLRAEFSPIQDLEVVISGPKSKLQALQNANVRPYLDLSDIQSAGSYQVALNCQIIGAEPELKVQSIRPEKVRIQVTEIQK